MSMTMQKVDDRNRLSLPLFYPNYKPDLRRFRISKDAKCFESSSRSSKSQLTHGSNQKSAWQQWESDSGRPNGTSLKSCLRKSSENGGKANENIKDAKDGDFKDADSDVTFTATEIGNKFSKRKWRATKIGHKDSIDGNRGNETSENIKMKKGCNYTRFRYPLRFHYGSVVQSKPRLISAIPATYQTVSFYSSLPRRQCQIAPDNNMSSKKNRRGTDGKQKHETKASPEQKTENEKEDSRASSPERELNGVYHIVHETETAEVHDTKTAHTQESIITPKRNKRTTKNQSDSTDDGASEVNDDDVDSSKSLSSKSSHSDRSEESVRETASSTDERSLKKEKNETESSDDDDPRRSRKKEEKKRKKKKKDVDKNERETEYAADFDDNNSEVLTED